MAYAASMLTVIDPNARQTPNAARPRWTGRWRLKTSDTIATATAAGYISDAADRGVFPGDDILLAASDGSTLLRAFSYNADGQLLVINTDLDADLDALAALSGVGAVTRTAANTFAARTLTGTANEIAVANGDGAAGNPTVSLANALRTTFTPTTTLDTPDDVVFTQEVGSLGRIVRLGSLALGSMWCIFTTNAYTGSPAGTLRIGGIPNTITQGADGFSASRWTNINLTTGHVQIGAQFNGVGSFRMFSSGDNTGLTTFGPAQISPSTTHQIVFDFWFYTED